MVSHDPIVNWPWSDLTTVGSDHGPIKLNWIWMINHLEEKTDNYEAQTTGCKDIGFKSLSMI